MGAALDTDALRAAADVLDRLGDLSDPADVACAAAEIRAMLDTAASTLTRAREASAARMARAGMTAAEIGAALGVSRQRAHLLASAGARQGWGTVTVPADAGRDPRAEYDAYLEADYQAAEETCRGQLVKPEHRADVDPRSFWWRRGPLRISAVSEELAAYWRVGEFAGPLPSRVPLTFTEWTAAYRENGDQ